MKVLSRFLELRITRPILMESCMVEGLEFWVYIAI